MGHECDLLVAGTHISLPCTSPNRVRDPARMALDSVRHDSATMGRRKRAPHNNKMQQARPGANGASLLILVLDRQGY